MNDVMSLSILNICSKMNNTRMIFILLFPFFVLETLSLNITEWLRNSWSFGDIYRKNLIHTFKCQLNMNQSAVHYKILRHDSYWIECHSEETKFNWNLIFRNTKLERKYRLKMEYKVKRSHTSNVQFNQMKRKLW